MTMDEQQRKCKACDVTPDGGIVACTVHQSLTAISMLATSDLAPILGHMERVMCAVLGRVINLENAFWSGPAQAPPNPESGAKLQDAAGVSIDLEATFPEPFPYRYQCPVPDCNESATSFDPAQGWKCPKHFRAVKCPIPGCEKAGEEPKSEFGAVIKAGVEGEALRLEPVSIDEVTGMRDGSAQAILDAATGRVQLSPAERGRLEMIYRMTVTLHRMMVAERDVDPPRGIPRTHLREL